MPLEKDEEGLSDRSCEKEKVLNTVKEKRNVLLATKLRNANWIGHTFRRNCLLKHVTKGKKVREYEEEEEVRSYLMTLRKRENTKT
jgi:hypothetical protein